MIPYGKQVVDRTDIQAITEAVDSGWLTTGPSVKAFEKAVTRYTGAKFGVAVSSGTAALHAAMYALGIGPGDEVIVPPISFAATANCVVYQGGHPVFSEVKDDTLLMDTESVLSKITERTRAIICVDYAGQPCDYLSLRRIADDHGLALVADSCHALGAEYHGQRIGTLGDLTVFSFHPVKHITTGEGGMVVTDHLEYADRIRRFRNHGINADSHQRYENDTWYYEITDLGYNYRLTDIQCALGTSQLQKLDQFLQRRREIAAQYDKSLNRMDGITPLTVQQGVRHAYHLYVVMLDPDIDRARVFQHMRQSGVGVNVHYIPIHLHPYYQNRFNTGPGMCPVSELAYERILSLPMHPGLADDEINTVVGSIQAFLD